RVEVSLGAGEAYLDVSFYNQHLLGAWLVPGAVASPSALFPIAGGHRLPAGPATGEVRVVGIQAAGSPHTLRPAVRPVGDYPTYTLSVVATGIDPVFGAIDFKFRPACFSIDCAPEWPVPPVPAAQPAIDYLAKDYDSFRHVLLAALAERVPGFRP